MSFPAFAFSVEGTIAHYEVAFQPFIHQKSILIAIRNFERDGKAKVLALDPYTLETSEISADRIHFPPAVAEKFWDLSPFSRALVKHTAPPCPLQNDGLTEADIPLTGTFLTVDLCPSQKPFEKRLFEGLIDLWKDRREAAPVALAITGAWATRHEEELQWLREQIREHKLRVTWINHSFNHPYDRAKPLEENFLLTPGTDFEQEVLSNEVMLLERGLLPSVFFRFPGLVSDCDLIDRLRKLSLIPVGSRAWLAKGEMPQEGSIILVHGNGNEPQGVDLLLKLFLNHRDEFTHGAWEFRPLSSALMRN